MEFKNLLDYSAKTWSPIVLPQMVIDELCRLYEIEINKAFGSAQSRLKELNGLMLDRKYLLPDEFDSEQPPLKLNRRAGWLENDWTIPLLG